MTINTPKADKLLPCPFLRCKTQRGPFMKTDNEEWDIARVACGDCGATGPFVDLADYGGDEKEAAAQAARLWNTRA